MSRDFRVFVIAVFLGIIVAALFLGRSLTVGVGAAALLVTVALATVASVWLLLLLLIALHELGHILGGHLAGFEFHSIRVGPLFWYFSDKELKFSWRKNILAGYATMLPRGLAHLNRRFAIFIMGGPVATFVCTIIAWCLPAAFGTNFHFEGIGAVDHAHRGLQMALSGIGIITTFLLIS